MLATAGVISKLSWWKSSFQDPRLLGGFIWTDGVSSLLADRPEASVLCHVALFIESSRHGSFI